MQQLDSRFLYSSPAKERETKATNSEAHAWCLCAKINFSPFVEMYDTMSRRSTCCRFWSSDTLLAQDFPWKCSGAANTSKCEETLTRYLQKAQWKGASGGGQSVDIATLRACDFSGARALLVASVPGRHAGDDLYRFCARP